MKVNENWNKKCLVLYTVVRILVLITIYISQSISPLQSQLISQLHVLKPQITYYILQITNRVWRLKVEDWRLKITADCHLLDSFDLLEDVQSSNDAAEDDVLAVQVWGRARRDEELAAVRARTYRTVIVTVSIVAEQSQSQSAQQQNSHGHSQHSSRTVTVTVSTAAVTVSKTRDRTAEDKE